MVQDIVNQAKPRMELAFKHYLEELKTVRTGRVSPNIFDSVMVTYYGVQTALKQLATVSVPDATQIVIQPFDSNAINDIRVAIQNSEYGFNSSDDGRVLRISVPPLNAERREDLVKKIGKISEEARVAIRNIRGEIWEEVQKAEKNAEISEDNRDWGRAELDKLAGEFNKKIETEMKEKEAEVRVV